MCVMKLFFLLGLDFFSVPAEAARLRSKSDFDKTIAGVPIYNYKLAFPDTVKKLASLHKPNVTWMCLAKPNVDDELLRTICNHPKVTCAHRGHESGVPFIKVYGTEDGLEDLLQRYHGDIELVEPDLKIVLPPSPPNEDNDVYTIAAKRSASWGLDRIGVPHPTRTGSGVHVYVLDTGVHTTHEDFEGRAIPTFEAGRNGRFGREFRRVCDPTDSNCAKDRQGHGTHCAGTVASKTYGVAKEATIHAVKVLGDDGSGQLSWMIDAMDWVTRHATKPAVISMSLGGKGGSKVEEAAVKRAVDAGITVVVAAGNDNDNACRYSPAFVKDAITVGATSSGDARASYSNFGSCVQIYAPGTNIKSLWHAGSSFSSSMPTKTISGTSMACPHVSGAAALLLGEDASLTPAKVTEKLVAASVKNVISGLTRQCPNKLLSVTDPVEEEPDEEDPISPPSKTCSEQAVHETPDSDGDCMCPYGMYCSVDGRSMSPCPFTSTWRKWLDIRYDFYAHTCTTCRCIHPYY